MHLLTRGPEESELKVLCRGQVYCMQNNIRPRGEPFHFVARDSDETLTRMFHYHRNQTLAPMGYWNHQ